MRFIHDYVFYSTRQALLVIVPVAFELLFQDCVKECVSDFARTSHKSLTMGILCSSTMKIQINKKILYLIACMLEQLSIGLPRRIERILAKRTTKIFVVMVKENSTTSSWWLGNPYPIRCRTGGSSTLIGDISF